MKNKKLFYIKLKMIKILKINSCSDPIPKDTESHVYINLMSEKNETHQFGSPYYVLNPKILKTDGFEANYNPGGIIFENFWQGSKVYETLWDIDIYDQRKNFGKKDHLIWQYRAPSGFSFQEHWNGYKIDPDYLTWRNNLWNCKFPIRFPNGKTKKRRNYLFGLEIAFNGEEIKYTPLKARQNIYFNEYGRLIDGLPILRELKELYDNGKTIVICSNDVVKSEVLNQRKLTKYFNSRAYPFYQAYTLACIIFYSENRGKVWKPHFYSTISLVELGIVDPIPINNEIVTDENNVISVEPLNNLNESSEFVYYYPELET